MGATNFYETIDAASPEKAFSALVGDALRMYGDDPYNGTISTCSHFTRPYKIADKCSKTAESKAFKLAQDEGFGTRGSARCLDLGVVEYRALSYETIKHTGSKPAAPKYKTRYVLAGGELNEKDLATFDTIAEAKAELAKMVSRSEFYGLVRIVKKPVLVSGSPTVAEYCVKEHVYKTKPKSTPKGSKLVEIHRYAFYGWASC